jgi:hypothetical protein
MSLSNVGFLRIVSCAHGYVGSDVSSLCSEAMEVSREREHARTPADGYLVWWLNNQTRDVDRIGRVKK